MDRIYEPQLRLQSISGGPLRGGEDYQFGFYDSGILRQILDETYSHSYKVWSLPVPATHEEFDYAQQLINDPKVQYALVDKNKIVFVVIEDNPGWMSAVSSSGYNVYSGPKTNKRLKSGHRPTLLNAHFDLDEINIKIVNPTDYSRYNFFDENDDWGVASEYRNPEVIERLLDGGFVISRRMIQKAVQNLPVYEPDSSLDLQDYYYDPRIRKNLTSQMLSAHVFNARIIFPGGHLKGNAFVADLPEGIDIITAQGNIKQEMSYDNGYRFLAEPQGPKNRVITDDQTVINLPKLFRKSDMTMWLSEEYKKMYNKATSGDLLTNWQYIYQRIWRDDQDLNENESRARMAYVGYRWTAAGFKVTESPWLFETVAISHAKPLQHRIPIPCAVYEQIIPESLARMAGHDLSIDEGTILQYLPLGCHVVNDIDWLEMYQSHGGMDQDDFFKLFYREMEGGDMHGNKVVIAVRSPNGFGEYTIFNYIEGAPNPTWEKSDGTLVSFPIVNGRGWPKRLSDAIASGEVTYDQLPSTFNPKSKRTGPYLQQDVLRDIEIAMAGGNVGGFVNATMAHSMVVTKHRLRQLCSLEDAIDKCINPDDKQDVMAIDQEANKIMREVIDSGKPIDRNFWVSRGMKRFLGKNEPVPELYDGKITQINTLCNEFYKDYVRQIRTWSQTNARPREIIHQIGRRFYFFALPILRQFRMNLYNTNASEESVISGSIDRNNWENIYSEIVNRIESYERFQDRCDFVLALYSVTIKVPTSAGKITDQIVMNRHVYPYLQQALEYYGISNIPVYNNTNGKMKIQIMKNDEWYWPNSVGELIKYTDPLEFQKAHSVDSPISFKMAPPSEERLERSIC